MAPNETAFQNALVYPGQWRRLNLGHIDCSWQCYQSAKCVIYVSIWIQRVEKIQHKLPAQNNLAIFTM